MISISKKAMATAMVMATGMVILIKQNHGTKRFGIKLQVQSNVNKTLKSSALQGFFVNIFWDVNKLKLNTPIITKAYLDLMGLIEYPIC